MKAIKTILSINRRIKQADGEPYYITCAVLDFPTDDPRDGEVFEGFGEDFAVGEYVEYWFDEKYHKAKFQRPRD